MRSAVLGTGAALRDGQRLFKLQHGSTKSAEVFPLGEFLSRAECEFN